MPVTSSYGSYDSLIPQETKGEIIASLQESQDEGGLWLYQLTGVQSSDVGFTWGTDMLLHRILTWAQEAESEEDFIHALKYFHQSEKLYNLLKEHISEIYKEVKNHAEWFA